VLTSALLVAASVLVGIGLAELLVRWIAPQAVLLVDRGLYLDDPPRGYRLNPGFAGKITNRVEYSTSVKVNAAGLRGAEIGAKAADLPRLLILGDSFVFGVGAEEEETYPARLAEHLEERGVKAEVLNGGVPGYGVPDDVSWYEGWGAPLAPDLVLLTVYVGNDLADAMPGQRATVIDGLLVVPGFDPGDLGFWLFHHSQLYVLLKTSPAGDAARRLLGRPIPLERAALAGELSQYARGAPSEIERVGGAATEEAVRRLAAAVPAGRLAAVLLPSPLAFDAAAWRDTLAAQSLDPNGYDPDRPTRWFLELFERYRIPAFDLTAALSASAARSERVYYPLDRHLNPAGYDLAAAEVAGFVAERLGAGFAPLPGPRPSG
jgi:lysophospholipase L1-like esterase